jgi:hypothetical protein
MLRRMVSRAVPLGESSAKDAPVLPNFLIVGAMRSGTTSLARYLGAHPEVFMAPVKEIHYFDRNFNQGINWYERHFLKATDEGAVGEASQTYMYDEDAVGRIATVLPKARLIAVLRNPVDRAYSHYWLNRALGREPLSFREAVDVEADRLAAGDRSARFAYSYLDRGRYLRQLVHLYDHFPDEAVCTVLFEDLRDRPGETYSWVCRFLGADTSFVPPHLGTPLNRFTTFRSVAIRERTKRLRPGVRRLIGHLNARTRQYPPLEQDLRASLLREFENDNAALASRLGRDLSIWSE